jgi:membrane associated rhomboid family serine protease
MDEPRRSSFYGPVTLTVAALAIGVTAAQWLGMDASPLYSNYKTFRGQLWRPFTSAFLHANAIHLIFNISWLLPFGGKLERVFGSGRFAGMVLLLAVASDLPEYALFAGGIGLSGVVYGLFSFLYVLQKNDERFQTALEPGTIKLFVGWFFFCIALTVTKIMPIGNVAHGAGALIGAILGIAVVHPGTRKACTAGIASLLIISAIGASVGRPYVNLAGAADEEHFCEGHAALQKKDYMKAREHFRQGVAVNPNNAYAWANLGLCEAVCENFPASNTALNRVGANGKPDPALAKFIAETRLYAAQHAHELEKFDDAALLYRRILDDDRNNPEIWMRLSGVEGALKNDKAALDALDHAMGLRQNDAQQNSYASQLYFAIGYQNQLAGQTADAVALYRKALALDSKRPEGWYNLGICHETLQDYAEAIKAHGKAAELAPNDEKFTKAVERLKPTPSKVGP